MYSNHGQYMDELKSPVAEITSGTPTMLDMHGSRR